MPPTAAPPNFYSNIAAMGGGAKPSPMAAAAPNPKTKELADAFKGIFAVMDKMAKMEPKLADKFPDIKKQLMVAASDAKIEPQMLNSEETEEPTGTVEGNKSPQEAGETPPAPSAESNEAKVPA
jgi:hypothetical protein